MNFIDNFLLNLISQSWVWEANDVSKVINIGITILVNERYWTWLTI